MYDDKLLHLSSHSNQLMQFTFPPRERHQNPHFLGPYNFKQSNLTLYTRNINYTVYLKGKEFTVSHSTNFNGSKKQYSHSSANTFDEKSTIDLKPTEFISAISQIFYQVFFIKKYVFISFKFNKNRQKFKQLKIFRKNSILKTYTRCHYFPLTNIF